MQPTVRFCTSADGTGIAFESRGSGPTLVRVGTWLTHLRHDGNSPLWSHWIDALSAGRTLVRYDERGSGASDRDAARFSIEAWVEDLEAVVDAAGLEQFSLLGMSNAAAVAVAYAARHPGRVNRLVLYGGFAQGRLRHDTSARARAEADLLVDLIRTGWGKANPAFRRIFTTLFVPDATNEQMAWFDEMQRVSASSVTAALMRQARQRIDVVDLLPRVETPTLVMHARDDAVAPFEQGRILAAGIDGARLVPLDGRNHILLADEPAWSAFTRELDGFLGGGDRAGTATGTLTARQTDVLRLLAGGRSNAEIAEALHLSEHTVHRHIANIYRALGLNTRAAASAYAALRGIL
ncbi:alpha/beta fold hydrolase [Zhihengliuella halotolerans]|uniref:DNA-binding NarL/FixJ family response regulator n=1 Tax=Zhihengliuella halotolerans TaxID=370736 RepID=A0A4V2G9R0_9MICC|nr:alpha/beta fold hydrolase [Zhihengliuella halotolerans]RZU61326.1 DNA-binding NarL/FixJ family response regulator [Zhihengliuella halotolerans]